MSQDTRNSYGSPIFLGGAALAGFDTGRHLPPMDGGNPEDGLEHELETPLQGIDKDFFRGKDFTENTFFMGAAMLAIIH